MNASPVEESEWSLVRSLQVSRSPTAIFAVAQVLEPIVERSVKVPSWSYWQVAVHEPVEPEQVAYSTSPLPHSIETLLP